MVFVNLLQITRGFWPCRRRSFDFTLLLAITATVGSPLHTPARTPHGIGACRDSYRRKPGCNRDLHPRTNRSCLDEMPGFSGHLARPSLACHDSYCRRQHRSRRSLDHSSRCIRRHRDIANRPDPCSFDTGRYHTRNSPHRVPVHPAHAAPACCCTRADRLLD
jgi:hypothetical protein